MVWRSRAGAGRTSLLPNRETPAIFPSTSGVPASTAAPPGLIDLVVVAEFDIAGSLTAAAVQARRAGAGLLIALARPVAVSRRTPRSHNVSSCGGGRRCSNLERLANQALDRTGVAFGTVLMTYRGGASQSGRNRRISAAMNHLARRRGATPPSATDQPTTPAACEPASLSPPVRRTTNES